MNILGIDLGAKRIGLATGSLEAKLSRPLMVISHISRQKDIEKILHVIKEHHISEVVIGISYQENGLPNSMGRHAQSFRKDLERISGLPVVFCDESLSTRQARDQAIMTGISRKDRRGHLDASAAAIILQSYFDSLTDESKSYDK